MSMIPILYDMPSKDPYQHENELNQVYEINQIHHVSVDVMKMKFFLATFRDRVKNWF